MNVSIQKKKIIMQSKFCLSFEMLFQGKSWRARTLCSLKQSTYVRYKPNELSLAPWWTTVFFFYPGPCQSYMKMQIGHKRISECQLMISGNTWSRASCTVSLWIIWNTMKISFVRESKRGTRCPLQIYGDSSLIVCYMIRYFIFSLSLLFQRISNFPCLSLWIQLEKRLSKCLRNLLFGFLEQR